MMIKSANNWSNRNVSIYNKDVASENEEIKCKNIINQYKIWWNLTVV